MLFRSPADADAEMADAAADAEENQETQPEIDGESQQRVPRQKTKITYDKYMKILNMLVRKVNEVDTAEGTGIDGEELINWYLEEIEGEMDNEEDYHNEKALVKKVIKRMMKVSSIHPRLYFHEIYSNLLNQDNILMAIRGDGLVPEGDGAGVSNESVHYVLHPNCAIEEVDIPQTKKLDAN